MLFLGLFNTIINTIIGLTIAHHLAENFSDYGGLCDQRYEFAADLRSDTPSKTVVSLKEAIIQICVKKSIIANQIEFLLFFSNSSNYYLSENITFAFVRFPVQKF